MSNELEIKNVAPNTAMTYSYNQYWFYQWVNNSAFYVLANSQYWNFYNRWVRNWLYWYDGFVPYVHNQQSGIFSTRIGTTIVNRTTDNILGGGLMFANSDSVYEKDENGVSKALDFISNRWSEAVGFKNVVKKAVRYAGAGGTSLLKLNGGHKGLWLESVRMDRFFADIDYQGHIKRVKSYLATYTKTVPGSKDNSIEQYYLVEERYFVELPLEKDIPVVEYKVYRLNGQVENFDLSGATVVGLNWEDIHKSIRKAIKEDYGDIKLNAPNRLPFENDLGCRCVRITDGISNLPQVQFGESLLSNILSYLYSYDYYFSCLNTDMYLGRGRVMVPKGLTGNKRGSGYNSGLDDFMYTKVEYQTTEDKKIEPVQFDLRAAEWKEIRNNLIESMATALGISVSTLASYLSDGSNRTAREVSAEEKGTTLFTEEKRRLIEQPINDILRLVLRYYGYIDDVKIRWSKAGMTNISLLTSTLREAKQAGLVSAKKAYSMWNFDDDEQQIQSGYEEMLKEQEEEERKKSEMFGSMDFENYGDSE